MFICRKIYYSFFFQQVANNKVRKSTIYLLTKGGKRWEIYMCTCCIVAWAIIKRIENYLSLIFCMLMNLIPLIFIFKGWKWNARRVIIETEWNTLLSRKMWRTRRARRSDACKWSMMRHNVFFIVPSEYLFQMMKFIIMSLAYFYRGPDQAIGFFNI